MFRSICAVVLSTHSGLSAKSTDIYHVITGESELPFRKTLDPVYYVGIYEERPKTMPKAVSTSSPMILFLTQHPRRNAVDVENSTISRL